MTSSVIIFTVMAFGLGMGIAWVQARRRMRENVRDQLVALAEERLKQEIIKRVADEAARDLSATVSDQVRAERARKVRDDEHT